MGGLGSASAAQVDELNAQVLEKNLTIEGLEKERDFYFGKLRDIEVLAQEYETQDGVGEFCQKVLGVLYATEVNSMLRCYTFKRKSCFSKLGILGFFVSVRKINFCLLT